MIIEVSSEKGNQMSRAMVLPILVSLVNHSLFLLLLIGFLHGACRVGGGGSGARPEQLSVDLPDYISIDCGAPEDYVDNRTGLPYKSDKFFIDSGISRTALQFNEKLSLQYKYLRSFPEGRRNCYSLKPRAGKGIPYSLRASFFYGNYDGKNHPPQFDMYLGGVLWQKLSSGRKRIEVNFVLSTDLIDVCVVNTGNGVPYISALELRRLDYPIYQMSYGDALGLWSRYDVGGIGVDHIRYPYDTYDRMWMPWQLDASSSISTNASISMSDGNPFRLPEIILKTAGRGQNSRTPLTFKWTPVDGSSQFFLCFHFAEVERLEAALFREISIVFNGVLTIAQSVKLEYLKAKTVCSKALPVEFRRENNVSISETSASYLPPILNGLEMFYTMELSNLSTFLQDRNAIREIKKIYNLDNYWQGDPCNPVAFTWDGLNCSSDNPSRIISLNLSWSKLTGEIAVSFSNLTALESLDLSYTHLSGPLPEFLARLPRLKTLNLIGNYFNGSVPKALIQKSKNGELTLSVDENPELCLSSSCKKKRKFVLPLAPVIILGGVILVILFSVFVISTRKRRDNLFKIKGSRGQKNKEFCYSEIVSMTDNFKTTIGGGGFGKVYLGILEDGTPVAVKLLSLSSRQGYREFQAEAQLLMIVHHRHLVSLVGYCDEGENKALIYEYMANGNVLQHISGTEGSTRILNWMERLQVAVDAAQGLEYLHNGCKPPIVHRDMKTSNILLNEKMQAKIADFGLSRILSSESASHLSTTPAGTFGYIDPEIHSSGNFTKKSDVYSFGIVLLELITGKPAILRGTDHSIHILGWIKPLIEQGNIKDIVDSRLLNGGVENTSAQKAIEIALWCTSTGSEQRPDISCVVMELMECLKSVEAKGQEMCSYASFGSDSILSPR